jgi:hypothetical protein
MTARSPSSEEKIWQVRLPDGSIYVAVDSQPGSARAGWIYARSTADAVAKELGGEVVEVTRRQHEKALDREIDTALAKAPRSKTKTRTRSFGRAARRAIAAAILESVPLNHRARSAIDTARETADTIAYKAALRALEAGLPTTLWVGYDADRDQGFAQQAEPIWMAVDPAGEDPAAWKQLERPEIARMLVEDA